MLRVTVINAHRRHRIRKKTIVTSVRTVLNAERRRRADVTVIFVDNRYCRRINRQFLGHDYATDVISFPMEPGESLEAEVYVNLDRARIQAREYRVSIMNEVIRLVIHGILHLTGYDDRSAAQRGRMRVREDAFVRVLAGTAY